MRTTVSTEAGVHIIAGHTTTSATDDHQLQACLDDAILLRGPVLVDLCQIATCSRAELHALSLAHARLSGAGRRLVIACPSAGAQRAQLRASGLDRALPVFENRHLAVDALRGAF